MDTLLDQLPTMDPMEMAIVAKWLAITDDDKLERRLKPMYEAMVDMWPHYENAPPLPSLESCVLAHRYQESWAPSMQECDGDGNGDGINLLVLGESHLSTDSSILGIQIDATEHQELALPQLGHINLVHCPSYGELTLLPVSLCEAMSSSNRNTVKIGTWQFWRVLSVLSGFTDHDPDNCENDVLESATPLRTVFSSLHKNTNSSLQKRLDAKAEILRCLRQRRIMFADVCPAPIAVGGDNCIKVLNKKSGKYYTTKRVVLNDADKSAIIRTAWTEYSSHLVKKYKPRYVLVLGRSVLSAIGADTIQESLTSHGGLLLGSMYHPSCNHAKSEACSRVMMRYLRQVALAACCSLGPAQSPRFPNIDEVSATILDIFNTTSNKKMIREKASGPPTKKSCKPSKNVPKAPTSCKLDKNVPETTTTCKPDKEIRKKTKSCKPDRTVSNSSKSCMLGTDKILSMSLKNCMPDGNLSEPLARRQVPSKHGNGDQADRPGSIPMETRQKKRKYVLDIEHAKLLTKRVEFGDGD